VLRLGESDAMSIPRERHDMGRHDMGRLDVDTPSADRLRCGVDLVACELLEGDECDGEEEVGAAVWCGAA
jgi:hypothetical protein